MIAYDFEEAYFDLVPEQRLAAWPAPPGCLCPVLSRSRAERNLELDKGVPEHDAFTKDSVALQTTWRS